MKGKAVRLIPSFLNIASQTGRHHYKVGVVLEASIRVKLFELAQCTGFGIVDSMQEPVRINDSIST